MSGRVDLGRVAHARRRGQCTKMASSNSVSEKFKSKKPLNDRWKWTEEKTDMFLVHVKAYKRQKLGEGIEWDSDKIVLLEHVRKNLGEKWPDDFGGRETSTPEMSVEDMTKDEYQKFSENLKMEKDLIGVGYRRVANKYKTLKRTYIKDCKEGLRSGAGQLTAKYWHDCHELWGGSASTTPLDFGMDTSSSVSEDQPTNLGDEDTTEQQTNTTVEDNDEVSDFDDGTSDLSSRSTSSETSRKTKGKKRAFQSATKLIDCKREKLQKKLTQEGKQDILLQHSQKQMDIQQAMLEAMNKKDEGLDAAIKSMAESAGLLTRTLAMGMQFMFNGMQPSSAGHQFGFPPGQHQTNQMNTSGQFAFHIPAQVQPPSTSTHSSQQNQAMYQGEGSSAEFQFIDYGND